MKNKLINNEIKQHNKKIKKTNINKIKKIIKHYYKINLKPYCELHETIKRINNMKKRDLYYEYILCLYDLEY